MKQLPIIFLILIVLLQTFSRLVVEADYFINKSYIAKVLCINKEKPKMQCNGKCYLTKQLKEQEKQEQQAPNSKREKLEVLPFFLPDQFTFATIQFSKREEYNYPVNIISSAFLPSVFRPPTI